MPTFAQVDRTLPDEVSADMAVMFPDAAIELMEEHDGTLFVSYSASCRHRHPWLDSHARTHRLMRGDNSEQRPRGAIGALSTNDNK